MTAVDLRPCRRCGQPHDPTSAMSRDGYCELCLDVEPLGHSRAER